MEPFIGQIMMFGGNFAPRGWAFCDGQLLSIASNTALFSILGTTYGGDGRTTFALPDLRGRVAVHPGTGPGLSTRRLGQRTGTEYNVLSVLNLPSHTHTATFKPYSFPIAIPAVDDDANSDEPTNNALAIPNIGGGNQIYSTAAPDTQLGPDSGEVQVGGNVTVYNTGGSQPLNNMQPFLATNYIIALVGLFPSRS